VTTIHAKLSEMAFSVVSSLPLNHAYSIKNTETHNFKIGLRVTGSDKTETFQLLQSMVPWRVIWTR